MGRMKKKQFLSVLLVYVFILTILPVGFIVDKVKAAETHAANYRHYSVLGYDVYESEMYEDYAVLFTEQGYILLDNNNKSTFRSYSKGYSGFMGRSGSDLYFYNFSSKSVEQVNINTGVTTSVKKIDTSNEAFMLDGTIDVKGNQWFTMMDYSQGDPKYYVLRIDSNGNKKTVETPTFAYELEVDSYNNLWFIDGQNQYNVFKVNYSNDKFDIKNTKMDAMVFDLKVNSKGDAFIHNEKGGIFQLKQSASGFELVQQIENKLDGENYPLAEFDIDSNDNIWVVTWNFNADWSQGEPDSIVAKLENNKLIEKYTINTPTNQRFISAFNEKRIIVYAPCQFNSTYIYTFINEAPANSGWVKGSNGKWRYYDPQTGVMKKGWLNDAGIWYYLDGNGEMKTGWSNVGGKWYFHDSKGAMKTGWLSNGGKWYFLASSGEMKTGWLLQGGKWYYLAGSGEMKTGWVQVGGKWYYFYSNGSMASNTTIGGYKLGNDGAWIQ
jgi:glucan-binding YG repeat protein